MTARSRSAKKRPSQQIEGEAHLSLRLHPTGERIRNLLDERERLLRTISTKKLALDQTIEKARADSQIMLDKLAPFMDRLQSASAKLHQLFAELLTPGRLSTSARKKVARVRRTLERAGLLDSIDDATNGLDVQTALDGLDAFVERRLVVVVEDGHRLLRKDRALIDLERRHVHRAPGDLHAVVESVADRVPPLEGRQQRRVGVEDAMRVGVVHRRTENGAEPRHHNEVDRRGLERFDEGAGVGVPVEARSEIGPFDDERRELVCRRNLGRPARTIDRDDLDGESGTQDGLQ